MKYLGHSILLVLLLLSSSVRRMYWKSWQAQTGQVESGSKPAPKQTQPLFSSLNNTSPEAEALTLYLSHLVGYFTPVRLDLNSLTSTSSGAQCPVLTLRLPSPSHDLPDLRFCPPSNFPALFPSTPLEKLLPVSIQPPRRVPCPFAVIASTESPASTSSCPAGNRLPPKAPSTHSFVGFPENISLLRLGAALIRFAPIHSLWLAPRSNAH
jgi:hypothetical protein